MSSTETLATAEGRFTAHVAGPLGAPLVLLLHGFPQSRHAWRHQVPALADAGYRAIAPDQRGYSPGVRPDPPPAWTHTPSTGWRPTPSTSPRRRDTAAPPVFISSGTTGAGRSPGWSPIDIPS